MLVLQVVLLINGSGAFFFSHLCGILAGYLWILVQDIGTQRSHTHLSGKIKRRKNL